MKNPLSLEGLISWLEQQDRTVTYDYDDASGCLCFQYFRALGLPVYAVGLGYWRSAHNRERERPLPPHFESIARNQPWTFGGALARAQAIQKELAP